MNKFKAIIFDCDGVLMDSESLACDAASTFLTENGYPITTNEYITTFMGRGFRDVIKKVKEETGIDVGKKELLAEKDRTRERIFEEKLKEIPHTAEVLEQLKMPYCIASGSETNRLKHSLGVVGLKDYFKDLIFSAELVEKGKPAPDIFLYAADKLNVDPKDCLVIEDGHHGAKAGVAAGMTVYGFTGGSHMTPERIQMLKDSGAEKLFSDMRELLKLI